MNQDDLRKKLLKATGGAAWLPPDRPNNSASNFQAESWELYFEERRVLQCPDTNNQLVAYLSLRSKGPLFVLHHGAGHAALAFALVAKIIRDKHPEDVSILAYDCRGHGNAMAALGKIKAFCDMRPHRFRSVSHVIQWFLDIHAIANPQSAQVSVPPLVIEARDEENENEVYYTWRTDLQASERYWKEWFQNLTEKFLQSKASKMLMLAGLGGRSAFQKQLWARQPWKLATTIRANSGEIMSLSLASMVVGGTGGVPSLQCAIAASSDFSREYNRANNLSVYDIHQNRVVHLRGHTTQHPQFGEMHRTVNAVKLVPATGHLLSIGHDEYVRIWDAASPMSTTNSNGSGDTRSAGGAGVGSSRPYPLLGSHHCPAIPTDIAVLDRAAVGQATVALSCNDCQVILFDLEATASHQRMNSNRGSGSSQWHSFGMAAPSKLIRPTILSDPTLQDHVISDMLFTSNLVYDRHQGTRSYGTKPVYIDDSDDDYGDEDAGGGDFLDPGTGKRRRREAAQAAIGAVADLTLNYKISGYPIPGKPKPLPTPNHSNNAHFLASASASALRSRMPRPNSLLVTAHEAPSARRDGCVQYWDIRAQRPLHRLTDVTGSVYCLDYHASAETLAYAHGRVSDPGSTPASRARKNTIRQARVSLGQVNQPKSFLAMELDHGFINVVKIRFVASGTQDDLCVIHDIRFPTKPLHKLAHHRDVSFNHHDGIFAVHWLDSSHVITGGADAKIKCWDIDLGDPLVHELSDPEGPICNMTVYGK
ncbi:Protein phosphatase methylesterase 1 [Dimargaris cristalligena]|nr:Protein phosphatase methylesterase 1 [Dimargaris cristalligena]